MRLSTDIKIAEPWNTLNNPVRNTKHEYLKFLNTDVFSAEARHFLRHGYYTNAPYGSKDWNDYWDEQEKRCFEGYSVGGVRVTGRHYFFLNFSMLKARPIDPITGLEKDTKKIITFPRFLDHQYYLFHEIEECFAEGPYKGLSLIGMIIAKSRRKGISFVNSGGVITYNYNFVPASLTTIAAYEAVHYNALLNGTHYVLNHLNKNTDWAKRRSKINRRDHFRASYVYIDEAGVEHEGGYMSEVQAKSFKDDPFKAIGDSTYTMCFEEGGRFKGLLDAYTIAEPTFRDGDIMTGVPMIWGCLPKGQKVWTNSGDLINIEDIKKEDGILSHKENNIFKDTIEYLKPPFVKPCYRITTTRNTVLECSKDHPILWSKKSNKYIHRHYENNKRIEDITTRRKKVVFKEAKDIKKTDQIAVVNSVPVFGNEEIWNPRMIGMLIGDGSYGLDKTPVFSNCDGELLNYLKSTCCSYKIEKEYLTKENKLYQEIRIKGITKELRKIGIYGQTKKDKRLPNNCFRLTELDASLLLAGLFDTDGYVNTKRIPSISLDSISLEMLKQVKFLLIKFGIHCTINTIKGKNRNRKINNINDYYRLVISDIVSVTNFASNIKLLVKTKRDRLNDFLSSNKESKEIQTGVFVNYDKSAKVTTLQELKGIRFETVKSIEYIGEKEVYNLKTKITHNYLANNIITHNTGGDIEAGGKDLEEMFYNPKAYGLKSYQNIYDDNAVGDCGWFIDDMWYMPGTTKEGHVLVDQHGNSYRELSEKILDEKRAVRASGSRLAYRKFITQQPKNPKEAFLRIDSSPFDTLRAQSRLTQILTNQDTYIKSIYTARLNPDPESGKIKYEFDPVSIPLREFPIKDWNAVEGCIEIYEHPVKNNEGEIPALRYIAGIDSYDADTSTTDSVGSIIVLDRLTDRIVCHFKGRPKANKFYETCRRILKYYNATANYERANKGLYQYFYTMHCLQLLCDEPEILKEKGISKATTFGNNAHPYDEFVMTPDGSKLWENIKIGDTLFNEAGDITKVIDIPFDGFADIYEIELFDGRKVKASSGHLWKVIEHNKYERIYSTEELLKRYKTNRKYKNGKVYNRRNIKIISSKAIDFAEKEVTIDPYTLGLLLGDGSFTGRMYNSIRFTSSLTDLEEYKKYVPYEFTKPSDGRHMYIKINNIGKYVKQLGLHNTRSNNKFIPDVYKYNSKKVRTELLKGLIDTDGGIDSNGYLSYSTTSKQLADDILFIVRSLGYNATVWKNKAGYKDRDNNFINCDDCYRVSIWTTDVLCKLERKINKLTINSSRIRSREKGITIKNIQYIGKEQCKCVTVDNPSGLYLINNFIVTHNSKGTAPSQPVNSWGRELSAHWSESKAYGEDEESEVVNMDKIRSLGILREMISYNDDGNFDDISALGMLMIYRENLLNLKVVRDSYNVPRQLDPFFLRHTPNNQHSRSLMEHNFRKSLVSGR